MTPKPFTTAKLTEGLRLTNTEDKNEATRYRYMRKGDKINIRIECIDDRTYYTYFIEDKEAVYTFSVMRKNNKLFMGYGGDWASTEIRQLLHPPDKHKRTKENKLDI